MGALPDPISTARRWAAGSRTFECTQVQKKKDEEQELTMTTQETSQESFAALFEASLAEGDLGREGEIVSGIVVQVGRDSVVVDIGGKSEGVIPRSEFAGTGGEVTVKAGDKVDVFIESRENDDEIGRAHV